MRLNDATAIAGLVNTAVYKNGVAILTSRRILWYQQPGGLVIEGHLSLVVNASKSRNFLKPSRYAGRGWRSPVHEVKLMCVGRGRARSRVHVFVKGQDGQRGEEAATKLEFHQGGKEEFLEQLRYVLQMKEWERVLPRPPGQLQVRACMRACLPPRPRAVHQSSVLTAARHSCYGPCQVKGRGGSA
jgi:hypothetical protein